MLQSTLSSVAGREDGNMAAGEILAMLSHNLYRLHPSLLNNSDTVVSCKPKLASLFRYEAIWFLILELGSGEDGWGLSRYLLTPSITWYPPGHRTSPRAAAPRTRSACASSHGTRGCGCWCRAGARTCTRQNPRSSWTLQKGNCISNSVLPLSLSCRAGMDVEISLLGISVRVLQSWHW